MDLTISCQYCNNTRRCNIFRLTINTGSAFVERGFFDDTLSAIRYAQKLAVTSGCAVQVSIAGGYTLNQRATSCTTGGFSQAVINPAGDQPGYSNSAPSGISVSSSAGSFTFDALGVASADVTIGIGASRQIIVVAATGFVYGAQ